MSERYWMFLHYILSSQSWLTRGKAYWQSCTSWWPLTPAWMYVCDQHIEVVGRGEGIIQFYVHYHRLPWCLGSTLHVEAVVLRRRDINLRFTEEQTILFASSIQLLFLLRTSLFCWNKTIFNLTWIQQLCPPGSVSGLHNNKLIY